MEESFLSLLLSYALTPTLSQREREFTCKILVVVTKTPPGNQAASLTTMRIVQLLRSSCVLSIQLFAQPLEVRIERHESGRPLKESHATRVMRHAIQRALAIAGRQVAVTGQANRRRVERINRDVAPVRFSDSAIDIERV